MRLKRGAGRAGGFQRQFGQVLRQLGAELPYATTVEIEHFTTEDSPKGELARIGAVIWVERESQKAIVIGKGGSRLRAIGETARGQIEPLVGGKVFLSIRVKVAKEWQRDPTQLGRLGF